MLAILLLLIFLTVFLLRAQRAGVERFSNTPSVAFYTVFCGTDQNESNVVNEPPSQRYPCFYLSNNRRTLDRAKERGWQVVRLPYPVEADEIVSAMQSKEAKAAPHRFEELRPFEYTVYHDSNLEVDAERIVDVIRRWSPEHAALLKPHPTIERNVLIELDEAMKQPRYRAGEKSLRRYMDRQFANGMAQEVRVHYATGLIVRWARHPRSVEMNETWIRHIGEAGIECQISFFFVQQLFGPSIGVLSLQ